jgi:tRNA uridine 5-carboxymethylaminomethyl modification enzyme
LKKQLIEKAYDILNNSYIGKRAEVEEYLSSLGFNELKGGILASELLKRPNVKFDKIKQFVPGLEDIQLDETATEQLEIMIKYEGYIAKQIREAKNVSKLDEMKIPLEIDYLNMDGLALEARQKLDMIRPLTIGQASRVSGVNPSDISVLILNVRKGKNNE